MRPSGKIWIKSVTSVLRIRKLLIRCAGTTVGIVVKIREKEFAGCATIIRSSSVVAGWAKDSVRKHAHAIYRFFFFFGGGGGGCKNENFH